MDSRMRLSRRGFLRLTGMGAASVAMVACVPAQPGTTTTGAEGETDDASPAQAAVAVRFASDWVEGVRGVAMESALEIFAEQNPDIAVELEPIGGDYFDRLQIQFSGGTVADAILFEGVLASDYITEGLIVDLADTLEVIGIDRTQWRPGVPSVFIEGDKLFATPFQLTPGAWYYNKTMFEEKGVALPTAEWGWDDVLDAAMQLTNAPETYGIWIRGNMFLEYGPFGLANGDLHWVTEDLTHTNFAEPSFADAIRWVIAAVRDHQVSPFPADVQGLLTAGISNFFATGKVGMAPLNAGSVGTFVDIIGDRFEWDLMPTPVAPLTGQTGGMWNDQPHVVTSNAVARDVLEPSTKLVAFLSGPEMQELIAVNRGSTPTLRSIQEGETYLAPPPESMEIIPSELDLRQGPLFFPGFLEWFRTCNKEFELGLIGERGVDETIEAMVTEADKVLTARGA